MSTRKVMLVVSLWVASCAVLPAQSESDGIFGVFTSGNIAPELRPGDPWMCKTGDPIYPANGEVRIQKTDLAVPSVGFPFSFTRCYRSGTSYNGPLGQRWDFDFNMHLTKLDARNINSYDGQGHVLAYVGHQQ